MNNKNLNISIYDQPDDFTCGPTCLHAVYNYLGYDIDLEKVIREVKYLNDGGTLAVYLGIDALSRGFSTILYSYNLKVFDPSWNGLSSEQLILKLNEQLEFKNGKKFTEATGAYINYLESGGRILFEDLSFDMLTNYFRKDLPVLAGLSATYLYQSAREHTLRHRIVYDDIRGYPSGHFVVLHGSDQADKILVADPYKENPISRKNYYEVEFRRLINSILLGIITYDANLLVITES